MKLPDFHPFRTTVVLIVLIGGPILIYLQIRSF
jgi:hypothetical protein